MSRHVVVGAGPAGQAIARALVGSGVDDVVLTSRTEVALPGARWARTDVHEPGAARAATSGADVVYFALNPPHYDRWPVEFPALLAPVLDAARHAGARLVALDNLYALDPARPLREDEPLRPAGAKGHTRAEMARSLLAVTDVEVAIGRASDFFGPGVTASAFGELVFGPALTEGRVQVLGDPDQPHTYSFVPDVGRTLAVLGTDPGPVAGMWHLPVPPAISTRAMLDLVWTAAGTRRRRLYAAGALGLRAYGVVRPLMREYLETLPQSTQPWVVDDSRFRARFADDPARWSPTSYAEAVAQTVAAFRATGLAARR